MTEKESTREKFSFFSRTGKTLIYFVILCLCLFSQFVRDNIWIRYKPDSLLKSEINDRSSSIEILDFGHAKSKGFVRISDEIISYEGKLSQSVTVSFPLPECFASKTSPEDSKRITFVLPFSATLLNCYRGIEGTKACPHQAGVSIHLIRHPFPENLFRFFLPIAGFLIYFVSAFLPWKFVLKRVLFMIPTMLGISLIAFIIIQAAPGDFTTVYRQNPAFSEQTIKDLKAKYGLDKPVIAQYFIWLYRVVFKQDFGESTKYIGSTVFSLISSRMKATFLLSIVALIFTWLISIPLGIYAAIRQYSPGDKILSILAFVGMSLPTFFIAFLLLYFASKGEWLPTGGLVSYNYDTLSALGKMKDYIKHMIIPVSVMVLSGIAGLMRLMRGNMLEVKRAQYVTTARAKGLSERVVIFKHIFRNAINPMVTLFGFQLSGLLSGVALTEAVLAYPGLGRLILDAVRSQDLFLVMGSMMMGSVLLLLGNLIADILLAVVDPRIKVQ